MTPIQWITNGEVGVSSQTIWSVLMGAVTGRESWTAYGPPSDADDFRRCVLLLDEIPEFRPRLAEVGDRFPIWVPLIREWPRLEALLSGIRTREDSYDASWHDVYRNVTDAMKPLIDEGRILDGWERTGPNSWRKDRNWNVALKSR
jgi:hypothetical protein